MADYRFSLEPLIVQKLEGSRFRVKRCPCGESNRDGKFVPFKGFQDRGYCHSCEAAYGVAKHTCPECKKENAFSRYVDTENAGAYLNDRVGKCLYCPYHYPPKQYFEDTKEENKKGKRKTKAPENLRKLELSCTKEKEVMLSNVNLSPISEPISFIPVPAFKQSLKHYEENYFVEFLLSRFGKEITSQLISRYFIGTSKHWNGATVFWQIDSKGKVRTGKIMLYSPSNGKRSKELHHRPTWVHKALQLPDFSLQQCFVGEHLLKGNNKPVAVVESEKTAIIASLYLPQFIWIAAGSKTGLSELKCQALRGRNVILFPDISKPKENQPTAFELWTRKAKEYAHLAHFRVSDLLERKATESEREQGLDIADYLLRFPLAAFQPNASQLYSNNIAALSGNNYTGRAFSDLIIQGYRFKDGSVYDVLFGHTGELLIPGEQDEAVQRLACFFEKQLQRAFLDDVPCWVHTDNRFVQTNN
jgi:hypothetical protein